MSYTPGNSLVELKTYFDPSQNSVVSEIKVSFYLLTLALQYKQKEPYNVKVAVPSSKSSSRWGHSERNCVRHWTMDIGQCLIIHSRVNPFEIQSCHPPLKRLVVVVAYLIIVSTQVLFFQYLNMNVEIDLWSDLNIDNIKIVNQLGLEADDFAKVKLGNI